MGAHCGERKEDFGFVLSVDTVPCSGTRIPSWAIELYKEYSLPFLKINLQMSGVNPVETFRKVAIYRYQPADHFGGDSDHNT